MDAASNTVSFSLNVLIARDGPDLANYDSVDNAVGNFEVPKMSGITTRYRRRSCVGASRSICNRLAN